METYQVRRDKLPVHLRDIVKLTKQSGERGVSLVSSPSANSSLQLGVGEGKWVSIPEVCTASGGRGRGRRDRGRSGAREAGAETRPSLTWQSIVVDEQERQAEGSGVLIRWNFTKNGVFTVQSAYELFKRMEDQCIVSTSRSFSMLTEGSSRFWKELWATPVPPRVKLSIWRFRFEAVPTMENLVKRRADVELQCMHYAADEKSLKHILLECTFARLAWALSDIPWALIGTWEMVLQPRSRVL
ncbi:hypothetical protein Salat_1093600 [Sesamum alatum]|uniref:Reverse transcriptase zinc-binding domain-containing protein n=1 Tax=Sesamum alatum TaxID=300844 RepID=A0AAE1YP28_9LAMI|nr:hypothetical protein Salat_1093600 [Sesamum alatum]